MRIADATESNTQMIGASSGIVAELRINSTARIAKTLPSSQVSGFL
ncbi:hypothetical protein [Acinetobacter baumannii]